MVRELGRGGRGADAIGLLVSSPRGVWGCEELFADDPRGMSIDVKLFPDAWGWVGGIPWESMDMASLLEFTRRYRCSALGPAAAVGGRWRSAESWVRLRVWLVGAAEDARALAARSDSSTPDLRLRRWIGGRFVLDVATEVLVRPRPSGGRGCTLSEPEPLAGANQSVQRLTIKARRASEYL